MAIWWWLIIALGLVAVELVTVDLIFLMLAGAAVAAGIAELLGLELLGQGIVFAVAAMILLFLVRPWAKRVLQRSTPDILTNTPALVGKGALVTQMVTRNGGQVRLDGQIWSARLEAASPHSMLAVGTAVVVKDIDGATAIVSPARAEVSPTSE